MELGRTSKAAPGRRRARPVGSAAAAMKFFAPATNTPSVTSSELDAMRAELEAMRQELAAMRAEQGVVTPGGVQLRQKSRILMKDASDHTMKRESSH